jgi:crotonobetainyl-CoA:carnitine CoA-transferase CaiB-like acyl-CoA transferase
VDVSTEGAGDRSSRQVAHPITLSGTPARYRLPPPRLGEHTAELLPPL